MTRREPWFTPPADAERHVLNPFDARDAISVAAAAGIAGKSPGTIRNWCESYCIGRHIAGGPLAISRAALAMLLNGDKAALGAYLSGDRASELVRAYFDGEAAKLTLTKTDPNRRVRGTDLRMPSKQPQSVAPGNARRLSVRSI
jgi:hypothetical protein